MPGFSSSSVAPGLTPASGVMPISGGALFQRTLFSSGSGQAHDRVLKVLRDRAGREFLVGIGRIGGRDGYRQHVADGSLRVPAQPEGIHAAEHQQPAAAALDEVLQELHLLGSEHVGFDVAAR